MELSLGIEPRRAPYQGARLPLHHDSVKDCQKDRCHPASATAHSRSHPATLAFHPSLVRGQYAECLHPIHKLGHKVCTPLHGAGCISSDKRGWPCHSPLDSLILDHSRRGSVNCMVKQLRRYCFNKRQRQHSNHSYPSLELERTTGIEPVHLPWQGRRLPLHHVRIEDGELGRIRTYIFVLGTPVLQTGSLTIGDSNSFLNLERMTGFEPVPNSLEGCDATITPHPQDCRS